jgi:hypothetical protein
MWDLWWTEWHCDMFMSEFIGFSLSVSFHHCSIPSITAHDVCDSPDQASHYHTLGPNLGTSPLTCHLVRTEEGSIYFVRFQILTVAKMKIRAFWDVAPCSLVGVYRYFRGTYCLHHQSIHIIYDGGSTHLWNVGILQEGYTALHPIRL